jgi:hypothetical protein
VSQNGRRVGEIELEIVLQYLPDLWQRDCIGDSYNDLVSCQMPDCIGDSVAIQRSKAAAFDLCIATEPPIQSHAILQYLHRHKRPFLLLR